MSTRLSWIHGSVLAALLLAVLAVPRRTPGRVMAVGMAGVMAAVMGRGHREFPRLAEGSKRAAHAACQISGAGQCAVRATSTRPHRKGNNARSHPNATRHIHDARALATNTAGSHPRGGGDAEPAVRCVGGTGTTTADAGCSTGLFGSRCCRCAPVNPIGRSPANEYTYGIGSGARRTGLTATAPDTGIAITGEGMAMDDLRATTARSLRGCGPSRCNSRGSITTIRASRSGDAPGRRWRSGSSRTDR